ncbi:MAG: site-specific DNA-methyltransferase [Clostridiales Family XIII bacterium]|jgi:DNA modification methylase|nr:site-specific DNA-methyltransferase [Clostridiales Family XIII bacterium]
MNGKIICGDALETLKTMPSESVNCCVVSPPYYGLRDYGAKGQIGLERTPAEYVARLAEAFREVRRVLRGDGTLWIVIADSYAGNGKGVTKEKRSRKAGSGQSGIKPKDLVGIPWALAFALRDDGWYLRSSIIWQKPNPVPESCRDRPARSHENVFLLSKSLKYHYDRAAVAQPVAAGTHARMNRAVSPEHKYARAAFGQTVQTFNKPRPNRAGVETKLADTRNLRDVWTVSTKSYRGAHFAVYPPELITPCILAGCPPGGVVLDPFFGSGTTGEVALRLGRRYIGIDLNPDYCRLAEERLKGAIVESG